MSDVKDRAVKITLCGIEYDLIFDLNVTEEIVEKYGSISAFTKKLFGDEQSCVKAIKAALTALVNESVEVHNESSSDKMALLTAKQVGRFLSLEDRPIICGIIMEAVKRSLPQVTIQGDELKN
jgi:hypothetical protein